MYIRVSVSRFWPRSKKHCELCALGLQFVGGESGQVRQVLVVVCGIFNLHCGIWNLLVACVMFSCSIWALVPNQGLNLSPLHWELEALATAPPGRLLGLIIYRCH